MEGDSEKLNTRLAGEANLNTRFQTSTAGSISEFLKWIFFKENFEPKWIILHQDLNSSSIYL